ncbi:hypothetical protein EYZ11_003348 [Aspergillus tanneri]|uniref:Uncharacterized protein n=1 Tax=Aspergillus tanneri TaxID=1220188 RepID=A0A4S3JNK4_9EURO|nr:hypothetical protein EYZ11_003348 [Aspergillus tanneri]
MPKSFCAQGTIVTPRISRSELHYRSQRWSIPELLPQLSRMGADPNCRNYKGDVAMHMTDYSRDVAGSLAVGAELEAKDN